MDHRSDGYPPSDTMIGCKNTDTMIVHSVDGSNANIIIYGEANETTTVTDHRSAHKNITTTLVDHRSVLSGSGKQIKVGTSSGDNISPKHGVVDKREACLPQDVSHGSITTQRNESTNNHKDEAKIQGTTEWRMNEATANSGTANDQCIAEQDKIRYCEEHAEVKKENIEHSGDRFWGRSSQGTNQRQK